MNKLIIVILIIALVLSTGCITATKTAYRDITATPEPTPTPAPPTPEPTPTPEPVPTLSPEQELGLTGGMHLNQWLSWERKNTSGYKDTSTHITVYGWREFGTVQWHSVSWGTDAYFREGAGEGKKFLFIFVKSYSDEGMARTWGIQPDQFYVNIDGQLYSPYKGLDPAIRLKEFDEIAFKEGDHTYAVTVKPYGYLRTYDRKGSETAEELQYLKAGKSNEWIGYIPFTIPADTSMDDIQIWGTFGSLSESKYWVLWN
jgi:hypothetical protein